MALWRCVVHVALVACFSGWRLCSDSVSLPSSIDGNDSVSLPASNDVSMPPSDDVSLPPIAAESDEGDELDPDVALACDSDDCSACDNSTLNGCAVHELNASGLDGDPDFIDAEEEHMQFMMLWRAGFNVSPSMSGASSSSSSSTGLSVPLPSQVASLSGIHDLVEFYSVPRLAPVARERGLLALLSLDVMTGWDFTYEHCRTCSLELLDRLEVWFLSVSPPCTMFSILQRMFNFRRWSESVLRDRLQEAELLLEHGMQACELQYRRGRFFFFEHPERSSAWDMQVPTRLAHLPGVSVVVLDMCMFGLKTKVHGVPMRKRTKIMTNCPELAAALQGHLCDGHNGACHQIIQGVEGGVARSVWAQRYPPAFVELVVSVLVRLRM